MTRSSRAALQTAAAPNTSSLTRGLLILLLGLCAAAVTMPVAAAPGRDHNQGQRIQLPAKHHVLAYRGARYHYHQGRFYRPGGASGYLLVSAPLGAIVPSLPAGFVTIGVGSRRSHYFAGTWYLPVANGYKVVERPKDLPADAGSNRSFAYPAAGQSAEQQRQDRFECYSWAVTETGFDPADQDQDQVLKPDYDRAFAACMEARQYVVR